MYRGYIKLWRCIEDNELWQEKPFDRARAWIDLIRKARHEGGSVWIRGIELELKKGQLAWSEVSLAENWGWSRNKVRRFLKMLKTKQQIEQENNNLTSLITIKNYDLYNPKEQEMEHQVEHQMIHQKDSKRNTKKNVKNVKNEKIIYTSTSSPEVSDLFSEYLKMSGRKKVALSKDRSQKISDRLSEFSKDEILNAWAAMADHDFLRHGEDGVTDYFTIDYAVKPKNIEKYLEKFYLLTKSK